MARWGVRRAHGSGCDRIGPSEWPPGCDGPGAASIRRRLQASRPGRSRRTPHRMATTASTARASKNTPKTTPKATSAERAGPSRATTED